MSQMREIGECLKNEQNLSSDEIIWLVAVAHALLRAFVWEDGQPMRSLAVTLGVSPTTFYKLLRLVVQALMWVYRRKQSVAGLVTQFEELEVRLMEMEAVAQQAQAKVQELIQALAAVQKKVDELQAEVSRLKAQWAMTVDRMILVLKMSGRCTVRSIVEVLEYGLGMHVSVGYVQGIIAQAGVKAGGLLEQVEQTISDVFSGVICVDEIYLKELGTKIWGVVIVDPLSGLVLRLKRCGDRSKDTLGDVLEEFAAAGFKEKIKLCLTDMYTGYLEPVKTYLPNAVHQFCWFHINCFHIGSTVLRAKRAYNRAVKDLAKFEKQNSKGLTASKQKERQKLVAAQDLAHRHWVGAQRFQRMLMRMLWSPSLAVATNRLEQLIRVAARVKNPYVRTMGAFLSDHQTGLLVFYTCLESNQHLLKRLSHSKQNWVTLTKRWAIPITSNAAEHVFRCLRRYTGQMNHFGTKEATQRFFDLFVFYHNLHTLRAGKRAGNSLLNVAHVDVVALFGTDDIYTILGFPPASQPFSTVKSVQSLPA